MSDNKQLKKGQKFFLSYNDLQNLDLGNSNTTFLKQLLSRGKSNYHLENKIKDLESLYYELSSKLDRLILLSSEAFSLTTEVATVDQFEIGRLKYNLETGKNISEEQKSMIRVSENKENNFKDFLHKLFPDIQIGVLKMMKRSEKDA